MSDQAKRIYVYSDVRSVYDLRAAIAEAAEEESE